MTVRMLSMLARVLTAIPAIGQDCFSETRHEPPFLIGSLSHTLVLDPLGGFQALAFGAARHAMESPHS